MYLDDIPKEHHGLAAMTAMHIYDGIAAYCQGRPRRPPEKPTGIWQTLWLTGWDQAKDMDDYSKLLSNQRIYEEGREAIESIPYAALARAKRIQAWRKRNPLSAIKTDATSEKE